MRPVHCGVLMRGCRMPPETDMHCFIHHIAAAALLTCLVAGQARAQCNPPPDEARWLLKVEHISTYPAGAEWDTRITVYEDGCLVMDAPKALREGGGRTERVVPTVHLDGLKAQIAGERMQEISAELLLGEMKRAGHADLGVLGADSVTDAPYTVVSFRDPGSEKASRAVEIYALDQLTLPKSLDRLAKVQDLVRTVDRLARAAALSRPEQSANRASRTQER